MSFSRGSGRDGKPVIAGGPGHYQTGQAEVAFAVVDQLDELSQASFARNR